MKLKPGIVGIYLLVLGACNTANENKLRQTHWIIGTWAQQTSSGITYETWTKVNDQEIKGKSYALRGKDTTLFETIQVLASSENIFYIPTVTDQNDGLPVRFVLKSISKNSWLCENQQHDFPQKIGYQQITKDSLVASISGIQNGKERTISFPMRRIE